MKTKKSKFFKAFGFSSLALLVGFGTTMAFVPLGATPSVASASEMSTQASESLVIPKKDDPVIFTTESGIEIKWGNAASATGGGSETGTYSYSSYVSGVGMTAPTQYSNLTSGNLSGFPYFTTSKSGTTYTWVIIGQNPNLKNAPKSYSGSTSSAKTEYKTLADWQSKITNSDTYANLIAGYSPTHKAFFNNTYEANTPAGVAIKNNGILNQTTARTYSASMSYSYTANMIAGTNTVKSNAEIPAGCVLALLNTTALTSYYYENSSIAANKWDAFQDQSIDHYAITYTPNRLRTACYNYGVNDTFGFGSLLSKLQQPTLAGRQYTDTHGTTTYTTSQLKFFPLGGSNYSSENFKWETYLTPAQYKLSVNTWCRSMYNKSSPYYTNTNGSIAYFSSCATTAYIRPACVLSIV